MGFCLLSVVKLLGLYGLSGKGEDKLLMLSAIPVLAVFSFPQPCITGPCFLISRYHIYDLVTPSWKTEIPFSTFHAEFL